MAFREEFEVCREQLRDGRGLRIERLLGWVRDCSEFRRPTSYSRAKLLMSGFEWKT
jgi:hypothetical protein